MLQRWALAPISSIAFGFLACGSSDEPTGTASAGVIGGDSRVATFEPTLPARAVGRIDRERLTPGGSRRVNCTASAIARNVVLFAAHCICEDIRVGTGVGGTVPGSRFVFHLPYQKGAKLLEPGPDPAKEYAPFAPDAGIPGVGTVGYFVHPQKCDPDLDSRPLSAAYADLAVMVLARALTPEELPSTLPVYTSGDFLDRALNLFSPGWDRGFFVGPLHMVGWAGTNEKRIGTVLPDQPVTFKSASGASWIEVKHGHAADTSIQKGDSGGPLTFLRDGAWPTEFGVAATLVDHHKGPDYVLYSPTFDHRYAAGAFIRNYLEDADGDGVFDAFDNCPPSRCKYPEKCANADQADADGDGVGDVCDNCSPSRCSARGWPVAACRNPSQVDGDGDGVGDFCDVCPETHDSTQYDADGDGVGFACDTCPYTKNAYRACNADSDCAERLPNGTATGVVARCVLPEAGAPRIFGRCTDGSACLDDAGCATGACDRGTLLGRCSRQLDDWDRDELGAACDSCPSVANANVQANSNPSREANLGADALADRCDPVPLYVTRPVIAAAPETSYKTITHLTGSTGIGSSSSTPSRAFPGRVVFKHCDCLTADGAVIGDAACRAAGNCSTDPHTMNGESWTPVTIGTTKSSAAAVGAELVRTFRDVVDCSDTHLHPVPPEGHPNPEGVTEEPCRVGNVEDIYWFHDEDVKAGRVRSFGSSAAGTQTVGILASQVLVDAVTIKNAAALPSYASTRDRDSLGALRFNFQYVRTPLFDDRFSKIALTLPSDWFDRVGIFRPGTGDPFRDPEDGPFGFLTSPVGIVATPSGVFALSGLGGGTDVTNAIPQELRMAFSMSGMSWLGPVESDRARMTPGARIAMIGMPSAWKQTFERPLVVATGAGGLRVATELGQPQGDLGQWQQQTNVPLASVFTGPLSTPHDAPTPTDPAGRPGRFVPGDRDDARALFSSSRRAVFMLGGRREGVPTGEIWEYAIDHGTWRRLFAAPLPGAAPVVTAEPLGVGDVLAATYDALSDRFVVIDETAVEPSEADTRRRAARPKTVRRLVVLDRRTESGHVLRIRKNAQKLSRFAVVAREDGTFVVLAQRTGTPTWMAFRLVIGPQGAATWTIIARGVGTLVGGAYAAAGDVVVPIASHDGGGLSFLRLPASQCRGPALDHDGDEPDQD